MKLKPIENNILVRVEPDTQEETRTAAGIIIPKELQEEKHSVGHVIARGRDCKNVKPFDVVLLSKWAGVKVKHDGADALLMKENDILAIIEQ